jgi:cytochrome c biogenesis protein ResB
MTILLKLTIVPRLSRLGQDQRRIQGSPVKKFIDKLSSLKLAVGLIAYLALTGILATLIPQGLAPEAYRAQYPRLIAELIVQTGFGSFFGSILFIVPALIFFANLSACTVKRFLRELKKKGSKRFGPDILHLGLMLLIIGSIWSYSSYDTASVTLAAGNAVKLPDGSVMELKDFRFERYEDGRPRDWVSVVDLSKDGTLLKENFELRVNSPLRYAGLTLYQASYLERSALVLKNAAGREFRMAQGEELSLEGLKLFFMAPEGTNPEQAMQAMPPPAVPAAGARAVLRVGDESGERVMRVGQGDTLGAISVLGFRTELSSGIQAVVDPGYPLVFFAFILISLGTALTFIQKLKELS